MKDLLKEIQEKDPGVESPLEKESRIEGFTFDEDFNNKLIEYNKKIKELDPLYSNLKPIHTNVIVRVYVNELKRTEGGILLPNQELIRIKTPSGYGSMQIVDNPYPYSRRAVVVAVPDGLEAIKPGEEIILTLRPIHAQGDGANATIGIPNWFTHPDFQGYIPTRDPSDPHYGYLIVDLYRDVQVKL